MENSINPRKVFNIQVSLPIGPDCLVCEFRDSKISLDADYNNIMGYYCWLFHKNLSENEKCKICYNLTKQVKEV